MKISVLTPSFNSGNYIERAIKSVLFQDFNNFEHIIIDGGSSDNTRSILLKYEHLIWISESDKGQSDAMNKAFKMASGDIIVYLNADDYFLPGAFKRVIREFNDDSDLDIIVSNLLNEYDGINSRITSPSIKFRQLILPFKHGFPYNPVSYFYKKRVQRSVGEFPIDNHLAMDYWFILRAFKDFSVKKINFEFGVFYHSGVNKTSLNKDFSLNKYAFSQAKEFGVIWQVYFVIFIIPEFFKKLFFAILNILKFITFFILLSRKISYKEFKNLGLRKAFFKI